MNCIFYEGYNLTLIARRAHDGKVFGDDRATAAAYALRRTLASATVAADALRSIGLIGDALEHALDYAYGKDRRG